MQYAEPYPPIREATNPIHFDKPDSKRTFDQILKAQWKTYRELISDHDLSPEVLGITIPRTKEDVLEYFEAMQHALHPESPVDLHSIDDEESPWFVGIKKGGRLVFSTRLVQPPESSPRVKEKGYLEGEGAEVSLLQEHLTRTGFEGDLLMLAGTARVAEQYKGGYKPTVLYRLALALQKAIDDNNNLMIASTARVENTVHPTSSADLLESTFDELHMKYLRSGRLRRDIPTDLIISYVSKEDLHQCLQEVVGAIKNLEHKAQIRSRSILPRELQAQTQ